MDKPVKKTKAELKAELGRPTKYDPAYCDMLEDHMAQGFSFDSFSGVISVNRDSLYEWTKVYQAFSDAKKRAYGKNLLWWERAGVNGLWGSKEASFNSTVWIFNMKNRHRWLDRQDIEMGHTVKPLRVEYEKLSDAELLELEEADKKVEQ